MAWAAAIMVALVLIQLCVPPVAGNGEPDASGHPTWQERANHVLLNGVRMAPSQYKSKYMAGYSPDPSGILTSYTSVPPVYLEPALVNSAFFHSNDMVVHNCFSHPSCDGTDTFERIRSYYTCSGTMGENIAAGFADPKDTTNQWLCDNTGSACAGDKSGNDGHRSNMMSGSYKAVGVGYQYGASATYKHYWTQDFGGAVCTPSNSPIYGGSHRIQSGTTQFMAAFYTSPAVAPSSATVIVAGTSYNLALDIGAAGAGLYSFSQTAGTGCRSYYFQFDSVRYPTTGCLVTYGEGSCTTSFDAACAGSGTSGTPTTAPTSAPVTTKPTTQPTTSSTGTPTSAPTLAPTSAPVTTKPTPQPTNSPSTYWVYTSSLQNAWTHYIPSADTYQDGAIFQGVAGLSVSLSASSGSNFIMLDHQPAVTNIWSMLTFKAACTSGGGTVLVYFNGGYYQQLSLTSTLQTFNIPMTSLGNPKASGAKYSSLGAPQQLVFQNAGSATANLFLSLVGFY